METRELLTPVKFVINNATYDTATAKALAISRGTRLSPEEETRFQDTLYRTHAGALFLHEHSTVKGRRGKPVVQDRARPLSPDEAVIWISATGAAVLDAEDLPLPPAA